MCVAKVRVGTAQFRLGSDERPELVPLQEEQQQTDYATDVQDNVGFRDVQSEAEPMLTASQMEATPEVKGTSFPYDPYDEPTASGIAPEEIAPQQKSYYKKIPLEKQKKRGRKPKNQEQTEEEPAIFDDLMNLVDERKLTPKKQPLTEASVRMTRRNTDHSKLVSTDTGISLLVMQKRKANSKY